MYETGKTKSTNASSQVLDTSAFPTEGRYEIWRDHFKTVGNLLVPKAQLDRFSARSEKWDLGGAMVHTSKATTRQIDRREAHVARSDVDHWHIRVQRTGIMASQNDTVSSLRRPGQLFVANLSEIYRHTWTDGEWVAVVLPRSLLAEWGLDISVLPKDVPDGENAKLLSNFLLSLPTLLKETEAAGLPTIQEHLRGMIDACLINAQSRKRVSAKDMARKKRAQIDGIIRREIGSARLDVNRIADLGGVSRATLYRLFDGEGGVANYVHELRLKNVRRALANPRFSNEPVSDVAARYGFFSPAAFSRSFRRKFKETPSSLRQRVMNTSFERSEADHGTALRMLSELR